jgi:HEAT repeats
MRTMNQLPRSASISSSILRCGVVFLLVASIAAQSRIIRPSQTNTNTAKRPHVATLRSSDSSEGSRVAISSDQSLNNYEAYRRGDRFYVKIPAADVPRAEAVRGRGFADVKAQRTGDSTVVSFRLQPGATAHVEQRANKLDVVVSVPGGGSPSVAANRTRENRPATNDSTRTEASKRAATPLTANKTANANKANASRSDTTSPALTNPNSSKSATTVATPAKSTPTPVSTPSPKQSPGAKPTGSLGQKGSLTQTNSSPTSPTNVANQPQGDFWARAKERAHYWILLAQLNPIPVALGAMLLVLFIGLLLFQRRRARATRRLKATGAKKDTAKESASELAVETEPSIDAAEVASATSPAATPEILSEVAPVVPVVAPAAAPSTSDDGRKERVSRTAEEARNVFAGEKYDESIIGSEDRETRRLVGAELASALVGRNAEKRELARAAFMKHGYFDDATRDLRVAESENERAAAARRLSFVNDREATPHLIGALGDSSPDVRRAAVEALMDLRDPAAIASLNSLLQTESDRKMPRNLIQNAIDACATGSTAATSPAVVPSTPVQTTPAISEPTTPVETEREVIEL